MKTVYLIEVKERYVKTNHDHTYNAQVCKDEATALHNAKDIMNAYVYDVKDMLNSEEAKVTSAYTLTDDDLLSGSIQHFMMAKIPNDTVFVFISITPYPVL